MPTNPAPRPNGDVFGGAGDHLPSPAPSLTGKLLGGSRGGRGVGQPLPSRIVHPEQLKAWMAADGITGMDAGLERPLPPPIPAEDAATPLIVRLERLEARLAEQEARLAALEAWVAGHGKG